MVPEKTGCHGFHKVTLAFFILGLNIFHIGCKLTTGPAFPLTEVEKAQKKLSDLNATQVEITKRLLEKRNQLLSLPKDSPPTRNVARQLAILNKQAGDLVSQVFAAELALEAAIAAADANATAGSSTNAPISSASEPDVPPLPGTKPEPTKPEPTKPEPKSS